MGSMLLVNVFNVYNECHWTFTLSASPRNRPVDLCSRPPHAPISATELAQKFFCGVQWCNAYVFSALRNLNKFTW